ncbi:hypothetical protein KKF84_10175, partial [Myxococcota bacterium]|nr:hypothetical protein [Myxococcota bacterium]
MLQLVWRTAIFSVAFTLCVGPLAAKNRHTDRKRVAKTKKYVKAKKPKKPAAVPFSADETRLQEMAGRPFVLKLRQRKINATDYLNAFHYTRGGVTLFEQGSYGDAIFRS